MSNNLSEGNVTLKYNNLVTSLFTLVETNSITLAEIKMMEDEFDQEFYAGKAIIINILKKILEGHGVISE